MIAEDLGIKRKVHHSIIDEKKKIKSNKTLKLIQRTEME